jgi:putative membrane protein
LLYAWRCRRQKLRPTALQIIALAAGLITLFFSLNGPLHDLSDDYLFSAHMVQHLVLTFIVAPLLIIGTPGWMLRPALQYGWVRAMAQWLTRPGVCFLSFNVVFAAWHLPPLFNLAMAHHPIHIFEHLMFLVTATLLWWPFLSPLPELPRLSYPGQMLYAFLTTLPMSVTAVYISLADHILYPAYAAAPRISSLTPMQDQQLGGLIMWVPGGLFFGVIMTFVFFKWVASGSDDRASAQVDAPLRPVGAARERPLR